MPRLVIPSISKNTLYILPYILLLATDNLFHPFANPKEGFGPTYIQIIASFQKLVGLAAICILIINLLKFRGILLFINILLLMYFIVLIFESVYHYDSFMMYPHVISKFFDLFVVLAIYAIYVHRRIPNFSLIMIFIILGLLMQISLNPSMISLQAFVAHDRGLPAGSVYLLSLPCLYYFNQYITSQKIGFLLIFLFLLLFILIANHRTVWVTLSFSLLVNITLIRKNEKFKIGKMLPAVFLVMAVSVYTLILAISYSPKVEEKILTNVTNILNPTEDGTGSWRLQQIQSYLPIVEKNFITGMHWKGFELPIQFYHPEAGTAFFEDGTGHHFHSFYFDILFYFGIVGLIIFIIAMVLPVITVISNRLSLNNLQLSFFIFSLSGFVYGLSYTLTFAYWLILGITIVHVQNAYRDKFEENAALETKDTALPAASEEKVVDSLSY
jgi:O-antigen ligase